MAYLLVFAAAFLAFSVSAVAGGGAGLALMPVLGLVVAASQVPAALSVGTAASAMSRALVFRHDIRWDVVKWFVPAAVPFTILGVWLLSIAQPLWVEFALGLFLAANLAMPARKRASRVCSVPGRPALVAVGAAAGLLSGFTGAVGVVFNGFYLRSGLTKRQLVATRGANELLLHCLKIGLYAAFGLLGREALQAGLLIAIAAILASFAIRPLLRFVSEPLFRGVNYMAMGLAGIAMLFTAGGALAARYEIVFGGKLTAGLVEARLGIGRDAISLEWTRADGLEIERTVSAERLPPKIREAAATIVDATGGAPARYEEVRGVRGLSYEVNVGGVTRHLVVTD